MDSSYLKKSMLAAAALASVMMVCPADAGCAVTQALGCYDDGGGARTLGNVSMPGGPNTPMDHALCAQICHQHKLPLAGVEYSYQCFCGDKINKLSVTKPAGDCSSPCTANHSEPCGGGNRIWVYKYSCSGAPVPVPPPLPPPPPPPAPGPAPPPTHPIGPGGVPDCPHPELKYCDASLGLSERVGDMISHMSPVDKLKTLGQSPSGNAPNGSSLWPRGGYRFWTEALHGVCTGCTGGTCATQFPAPSGLATAMNRTLWRAIGSAISTEGESATSTRLPMLIKLKCVVYPFQFLTCMLLKHTARALFKFGKISGLGFFAPQLNLWTNPLWGRNLEAPGEDPYISGEYGQAWVRGLQGHNESAHGYRKAYATPKHFIGQMYESAVFPNGTLIERYRNDTRYSLHDLEFYLQPFRKAMIADGGDARSTMCAYQSVNGAPVCANGFILNKVVKAKCDPGDDATCGSWGWEGFVSSDCDSVQTMMPPLFNHAPNDHPGWPGHNYSWNGAMATADALRGGDDTNCGSIFQDEDHSGIMSLTTYPELLTDGIIDQRLRATLTNLFELGLFDGEAGGKAFDYGWEEIDSAAHRALNLEAARQSIVLLQNPTHSSDSTDAEADAQSAAAAAAPILPLKPGTKVAVLGYQATWTTQLMGNYNGDYSNITTIADAIRAANGAGSNTPPAVHGVPTNSIHQMGQSGFPAALEAATAAEVIILTAGLDKEVEGEGCDRSFLQLPGEQEALYTALAKLGKPIVVVLINGGMVAIDLMKDAPQTAILEASYPGARGGEAIADTIFGRSVPSGKLAATVWSKSFQNLTSVDESNLTWACSPTAIHSEWQWNPAVRAREGSDGLTHMFYQGDEANILWKFGFGLSFSEFEMSWLQPDEPAVMTIDIGAPD
jgi:beta-glucosidase-like glycosyl hydrolase